MKFSFVELNLEIAQFLTIFSFLTCSVDAVLSIAVIHHIATAERRVHALRELSRVLRVGGRVMISVWAMEQRQRRFESQDVLIPWHRPTLSHSLEVFCLLSLFTVQLFVYIYLFTLGGLPRHQQRGDARGRVRSGRALNHCHL